jgi:hypothetical protein
MCKFVEVIVPNDDEIHLVWWYTNKGGVVIEHHPTFI